MRRSRPYVLLLILLSILAGPILASPAVAAPITAAAAQIVAAPTPGTDCLVPPMPESPTAGVASSIDPGPADARTGDPFAENSETTLYDVYGYAGYEVVRFDPGCGWSWDPNTEMANVAGTIGKIAVAMAVRLVRMVMTGGFGSLWDPVQNEAARILGNGLFLPLIGVGVFITALYFMASAGKADPAKAVSQSMGTALILGMGMAAATYTLTVGATIDRGITGAFAAANQMVNATAGPDRDAADSVAANILTQIQYNTWVTQTLGDDAAARAAYGPDLFRAGAFTREEQRSISVITDEDKETFKKEATDEARKNPDSIASSVTAEKKAEMKVENEPGVVLGAKAKALIDKKQADYKATAEKIKNEYPQAYYHLAGNDSHSAAGHSLVGLVATGAAVAFLLYCLVRMMWAMVVVRVGIGVMSMVALFAQFPRLHHVAMSLFSWIVEAVGKAALFSFAFVVYLSGGIGGIMAPETDWHPLAKALALIMLSYALWKLSARLGMSGKATWHLPKVKKDKHQYGRRWDKEDRPSRRERREEWERSQDPRPGGRGEPESSFRGGGKKGGKRSDGGTGPIVKRGQRVPGMDHVYGGADLPLVSDIAKGKGAAGKVAAIVPGGKTAAAGVKAAQEAAGKPRGTPGGLGRTSQPDQRKQTASERAMSFPKPIHNKTPNKGTQPPRLPGVGSTVMSRQSTVKPLPNHHPRTDTP